MSATKILKRRKEAKNCLNDIFNSRKFCLLIHYSCESFYDKVDGHSPRITSIAIREFHSGQTKSFSIHQYAEKDGVPLSEIPSDFDTLEKKMLTEFYEFVDKNKNMKWIHWNMRDINYGFEAIAHRFKVLGGNPIEIPSENLVDLSRVLIMLYTPYYISHPRLECLIDLNKITKRDFLSGSDEAKAFEEREYVKLHQSTLRKVDIFSNILGRIEDDSLKVNLPRFHIIKLYPEYCIEKIKNHWVFSLLMVLGAIFGFVYKVFNLGS